MSAPTLRDNWREILQALPVGWDSYGAAQITAAALDTLGAFHVVPCGNGGIQLEVHRDGFDLEIGIAPDGKMDCLFIARRGE